MTMFLLWLACGLISLPAAYLALECLLGSINRPRQGDSHAAPPFTVLMPAHDEAAGIAASIEAVQAQLGPRDRLIVIADNCTDDTALIAHRLGAILVERTDPHRRGKGYALEAGRAAVRSRPGEIVIIVDADCEPGPKALPRIAATASRHKAVVQGAYLLRPGPNASVVVQLSCFAFLVKNLVRQLGLVRMSGHALLQGSGMAFPWSVFRRLDLCSGSIVEDLEMGLELLLAGERVIFDAASDFTSDASSRGGTADQRRRWEHGMLAAAGRFIPRLLKAGLTGRPRLLLIAMDLAVPPTMALIGAALATAIITGLVSGLSTPLLLLAAAMLLLCTALFTAWMRHGKAMLPARRLLAAPAYLAWKLPIIVQFVTNRQRDWLRTEREP